VPVKKLATFAGVKIRPHLCFLFNQRTENRIVNGLERRIQPVVKASIASEKMVNLQLRLVISVLLRVGSAVTDGYQIEDGGACRQLCGMKEDRERLRCLLLLDEKGRVYSYPY